MYRDLRVAAILPCFNEERLIAKTVSSLPGFVDDIIIVDDQSGDGTWSEIQRLASENSKIRAIQHERNTGIGGAYISGFNWSLANNCDLVFTMAGDAQCNTDYMPAMINKLIDHDLDYVKANRFVHLEELKQMPAFRRVGNTVITILTKFATGYYSVFDSQNGYGVFKRKTLEDLPFEHIGRRYDYENTLLISLAIMDATVSDEPVPAIYGDETSTIPVFKTTMRALRVIWSGYWRRMYYKYIVVNFHPIALFTILGIFLGAFGALFGIYLLIDRAISGISPTSGSVILSVLPIILGLQLCLTAVTMDMNNDTKH